MDAIMTRRSTRKFTEQSVEPEKLERILRAAMQSPTGHDAQDWEFLIVTDPAVREQVSQASPFTVSAKNAPVLIVPLLNREKAVPGEPLWQCDMGAVCQTILLQAEDEGLGAVWLGIYPHEDRVAYLKTLFSLPEHILPYAVIPVGYKLREKPPVDRFDPEKIHYEQYGRQER